VKSALTLFSVYNEYNKKAKALYIKRTKPKLNCIIKINPLVKEE